MHADKAPAVVLVKKRTLIKLFSLLSIFFFSMYALFYSLNGNNSFVVLYLVSFGCVGVNYIIYLITANEQLAFYGLAFVGLPVLLPWQVTGGISGGGIFTYFLYIPWLFFLLGKRKGLIAITFMFFASLTLTMLQHFGYFTNFYKTVTLVSFYYSFVVQTVLMYFFQVAKEKTEAGLILQSQALKKAQDRLDLSLHSAKMGAWEFDLVKGTSTLSAEHDRIFGMQDSNANWDEEVFLSHVLPEDRAMVRQRFEDAFKTGIQEVQCRIVWPDQSIHWIEVLGRIYFNEQRRPIQMSGIIVDITQRKETETKLIAAQAMDEAILTSIGDGLAATDSEGRIMLVNPVFERLLGLRFGDVQGKKFIDVVPMVNSAGVAVEGSKRLVTKALSEMRIISSDTTGDKYYQRAGAAAFPVAVTVSPIIVDKRLIGAVEVFRDITREKEIDKAKTEFVSLASHQLRTPLSSINWYSEMLLNGDAGPVNDQQKKYLGKVYGGNRRMIKLVNTLLNVSRIDIGTLAVDSESVDVKALMHSVIDEEKQVIAEKKLRLTEQYDEKLPHVSTDSKLLRMVFQNIVSNAVKYTGAEGSLEIKAALKGGGSSVMISVRDTGLGIPKAQHRQIFTKLFRADNARMSEADGTGLGLYIVKSILDALGGKIGFDSAENEGTTFYVELPLSGMKAKDGKKLVAAQGEGGSALKE